MALLKAGINGEQVSDDLKDILIIEISKLSLSTYFFIIDWSLSLFSLVYVTLIVSLAFALTLMNPD